MSNEPQSDETPPTRNELSILADAAGPLVVMDPGKASAQIVANILAAETLDEILSLHETGDAKGLKDQPLMFCDVQFQASTFEQGSPVYGVIKYRDIVNVKTGEAGDREKTMTTGGANVMAQLANIKAKNLFPFPAKLITKKTSNDFDVLWLANI